MELRLDILALLALPASGKSEVRRYLDHIDPETARREMALGPTAQLDDYPYVHLMRRISQELHALEVDPVFFDSDQSPWREPADWITLMHLLQDDYEALVSQGRSVPSGSEFLEWLESARDRAGAPPPFRELSPKKRSALAASIAADVASLGPIEPIDGDATIVLEFARGGPEGASLPLPHPLGYAASLGALGDDILDRMTVLYVWVDPAESRRRNRERALPGAAGDASILHHGVPEQVMRHDYGLDDMAWLESQARTPGTIPIGTHDVPMERFDNRVDRTSFLRGDPSTWPPSAVTTLHGDLSRALQRLAARRASGTARGPVGGR